MVGTAIAPSKFDPDSILLTISAVLGIPLKKIIKRDRSQELKEARQMMMYVLKYYADRRISLKRIGELVSIEDKPLDHTTVIHGIKAFKDRIDTETHWQYQLQEVVSRLETSVSGIRIKDYHHDQNPTKHE